MNSVSREELEIWRRFSICVQNDSCFDTFRIENNHGSCIKQNKM